MTTLLATKKRRVDQRLWNKLDEFLLPEIKKGVILAISGGPDSRALLEAVATWPQRNRGSFLVVALDHGIRKEAEAECRLIIMRAKRLGFTAQIERLSTKPGANEQDLRLLRYLALTRIARERSLGCIVTAHQGDDNAEGFFMALMGVGGGELGAAMTEISDIDGISLCRPFLSLSKGDLLLSLTLNNHTDFVRDSCDEARVGKRAFVRHEIFPELSRNFFNLHQRLHGFARAQHQQRCLIEKIARSLIIWGDDHAILPLSATQDAAMVVAGLWLILKNFSKGKDMRSSAVMINRIAKDISDRKFDPKTSLPGLDPSSNGFSLKDLNVKRYQLPGAVVFKKNGEILVRRV